MSKTEQQFTGNRWS